MDKIQRIWMGVLAVLLLGIIFFYKTPRGEATMVMAEWEPEIEVEVTPTDVDVSEENAVLILLEESEVSILGDGASMKDGALLIAKPGTYCLSGHLEGSILVDVSQDESVHLVLDGVEVYTSGGAALYVKSGFKVVVTAKEGSRNVFCDTPYYNQQEEADSCIYSVADLTFNGKGATDIWGYYKDAVASKGVIKVVEGTYAVRAKDDGIRGRDGVVIIGGVLDIQAEGCGIKSTHSTNEKKGYVTISGGELSVLSGEHAVSAVQSLQIYDCNMHVQTVLESFLCAGRLQVAEDCVQYDKYE